ncbi:hypothetical protein PIB30_102115 [Stylosanthes scabra]|uniref:Uncharacterized protein n=1 Tax=Stylosanthes scabra TaxID=79078 RepID=A0ABU6VYW7_9FABA|nr:hypothetical protein [Stylosanthes scabra]
MALLTALVHYHGCRIEDDNIENNAPYDGPKSKAMSIKSSFTLKILKKNLHKKIGLKDNQVVGRMTYRIPHAVDAEKWQLVDVGDDIACLFDMHSGSDRYRTIVASAQKNLENSTPDSLRNPPDQENPLMRDILSDINDHEDDFLHGEDDDVDIDLDQPFQVMPSVGDVTGKGQIVAVSPPSYDVPPNSQFSDINWEAMDGSNEFSKF